MFFNNIPKIRILLAVFWQIFRGMGAEQDAWNGR